MVFAFSPVAVWRGALVPVFAGDLALGRRDLPVDLRLLSLLGLSPPLDRRLGTPPALHFALFRGPFAFVGEQRALVSRALPVSATRSRASAIRSRSSPR